MGVLASTMASPFFLPLSGASGEAKEGGRRDGEEATPRAAQTGVPRRRGQAGEEEKGMEKDTEKDTRAFADALEILANGSTRAHSPIAMLGGGMRGMADSEDEGEGEGNGGEDGGTSREEGEGDEVEGQCRHAETQPSG